MKCYIILTAIVVLTVSHAEEVEIVETREKCHHTPTGPVCDKEVLKREICTNGPGSVGPGSTGPGSTGPGSVGVCKKVEEDVHEIVETREKCRRTPTGPICDKEVLKREKCRRTPTGPICD